MKKIIQYSLYLALGLGLAWYASKDVDGAKIWDDAKHLKWQWVIFSTFFSYLAIVIRGLRWVILIEPLGVHARSSNTVHSVAFGYLMNNLIPRSGEVARCALLSRAEKIPVDKLVGTVILERLIDVCTLLLVIGLAATLQAEALHALLDKIQSSKSGAPADENAISLWWILAGLALLGLLGLWVLNQLKHKPFFGKIHAFLTGILDGIKTVSKLKNKFRFILFTAGIWISWMLMAYGMMQALPGTENMTIADALFFLVAGSFGMIVPVQGGLGAYHLTSKWGFEALGYTGALGLTFAWISWVGKTVLELVAGAIGFVIVDHRAKRQHQ
jgi:uncharacterized membrane protein YbhN (UPF0104 family)